MELMHVACTVLSAPQIAGPQWPWEGPAPNGGAGSTLRRRNRPNRRLRERSQDTSRSSSTSSCFNAQAGLGEVGAWEETKHGRAGSCLLSYWRGHRRI